MAKDFSFVLDISHMDAQSARQALDFYPGHVIASHANEVGTVGGKVRPGSKTERFVKAVKVPVHLPLSGRTMEFDGQGRCSAGC